MIFKSRYIEHLEAELIKQELLLKFVISDKENLIRRQDEEIKRLQGQISLLLAPKPFVANPKAGKPVDSGERNWKTYLNNYIKDEEAVMAKEARNGVHVEVGEVVHKPSSGDAGGPDAGPGGKAAN